MDKTTLPGLDEALDYLSEWIVAGTEGQDSTAVDDVDPDEIKTDDAGRVPCSPFPDDVLNALVILRLHQSVVDADHQPLRPPRGLLTTIIVRTAEDRSRVSRVLPKLSLVQSEREGPPAVLAEQEAGHNRYAPDLLGKIKEMLGRGRSTIAIISNPDVLSGSFAFLEMVRFTLPPINRRMLSSILDFLHPGQNPVVPLTDPQIARLPPIVFGPAVVAPTRDEAVAYLRRLGAPPAATGPTLDDVHGQPKAVDALRQIVRDLEASQAGTIRWTEVTRSVLLAGPPGTGKTMLAHALAGSAGINLVKTSYSDCQKHGHQGDMLRELNAAADRAVTGAPSVFFIDEIDSFYNREMSQSGYMIGVVNGALTLIDRLLATDGVIVIAATNDPERVDPAIIRSGRFDRHISVGPPDRAGIRAMLETETVKDLSNSCMAQIADQLLGLSGAEVAAVMRDARTRARASDRELTLTDLQAAADAVQPCPGIGLIWRVSVHEAGHVVAGHLLSLPPVSSVRISPRGGQVMRSHPAIMTNQNVHDMMCTLFAGRCAEAIVFEDISSGGGGGANSDLAQATRLAVQFECSFGFGETLAWLNADTPIPLLPEAIRKRVEATLQAANLAVHDLLEGQRVLLQRVATTLAEHRELEAAEIAELLTEGIEEPGVSAGGLDVERGHDQSVETVAGRNLRGPCTPWE